METEGRGFSSDLCRNTSEELFIKSLMETSMGTPAPTMEMLGFKNLSQNFRADSEELFKSWLTTGENNHGYGTSNIAHRTRQASKRMSTEITNLSSQQQQGAATSQNKKSTDVLLSQNNPTVDDIYNRQLTNKGAVDRNMQASNLYLAKAWFQSSQPMTRSRSSELRKRYVAMHTSGENSSSANDESGLRQEFSIQSRLGDPSLHDIANQMGTFNTPQSGSVDNVSSVVNMLKGTLERRKFGNQTDMGTMEDSPNASYHHAHGHGQEVMMNSTFNQINGGLDSLQELASAIAKTPVNTGFLETVQDVMGFEMEGFTKQPANSIHVNAVYQEPSPSESSAAAPVISSGFDGASNSSQNVTCGSSKKTDANGSEHDGSKTKEIRGRIIDNLKDDRKKGGGLVRYGSVTSATSVDTGDPTKKRRVERSRKMAEAKERSSTPAIPSDMQQVTKRCELLEKEVRSLKLNLSFMNRKDSEQTKQIEDLQKQNEELTEEKERLVEEIERMVAETGGKF